MLYFAYGSNISETRLRNRNIDFYKVGTHGLENYSLNFSKSSKDGSGKATLFENCGSTTIGILYDIPKNMVEKLDKIEGLGQGYNKIFIDNFFTYIADKNFIKDSLKPYDWYLFLILDGMISNKFPTDYIDKFSKVQTIFDKDRDRRLKHYFQLQNLELEVVFDSDLKIFKIVL